MAGNRNNTQAQNLNTEINTQAQTFETPELKHTEFKHRA